MSQFIHLNATKRVGARISLTPLIDVVFILLIFFMLASSFEKTRAVELTPPKSSKPSVSSVRSQSVVVEVLGKGSVKVGNAQMNVIDLEQALSADLVASYRVIVTPEATLQDLIHVLDITSQIPNLKISISAPQTGNLAQ